MARHLFPPRGGSDRDLEREIVRRRHLALVRSMRERHAFADPRLQLVDDEIARRYDAA